MGPQQFLRFTRYKLETTKPNTRYNARRSSQTLDTFLFPHSYGQIPSYKTLEPNMLRIRHLIDVNRQ